MLSQTAEMKTLDDFMCAIDGEGWSSNSAPEMAYITKMGFTDSDERKDKMKIKPINPVARALAVRRKRKQIVPDKTKYNRNKLKKQSSV